MSHTLAAERATVTVEDFSRLVSGIYGAAEAPHDWESALSDIQRAMAGTFAALVSADRYAWSSAQPSEAHRRQLDEAIEDASAAPVGAVRAATTATGDALLVRLTADPAPHCLIVGTSSRAQPFDTAQRKALLGTLVGHLQQALRMQTGMDEQVEHIRRLSEALEAVHHGVIVVGGDGVVGHLNSAARRILHTHDGLGLRSHRITAVDHSAKQRLRAAVQAATTGGAGNSFTCARPSGHSPYVLHVLPTHTPAALVVIIDPDDEPLPPADLIRQLYGLTPTEAQIAQHIAAGEEPKRIAEELSVSLTTVRTHLQHVFDKTHTHRQTGLIRLLLRLNP
jgi:DNA-binding CsgD family transcriptional regulator/PAS domain-containing protein